MPANDLREHVSDPDCWCKPRQDSEEPRLWVHNSADGREEIEKLIYGKTAIETPGSPWNM